MKIPDYSIREVQTMGISKIIKSSEENGVVVITKNHIPSAMIVPLTKVGFLKYISVFRELLEGAGDLEDSQHFFALLGKLDEWRKEDSMNLKDKF